MKRSWVLLSGLLAACSSTQLVHEKKDVSRSFNENAWNDSELVWVKRATALHDFMEDYYQNPRNFKARSILGLSEMQRVILRNRSEAWQPNLSERLLRVSWAVDSQKGILPYRWSFSKDWKILIQERAVSVRHGWMGADGMTLWILPTNDYKTMLSADDHEWLKSKGIIATDPDRDFHSEENTDHRKIAVDESGVYLENEIEDAIRVKSRIAVVINDVDPVYVDSSHRFLNRDLAVLRGEELLKELEASPKSDPKFVQDLKHNLANEKSGQPAAIEWLDKNVLQANKSKAKNYGFAGLWEAYLKGFVQVSNVPGLEYQSDPQFLSHLDQLTQLYLGKSYGLPKAVRQPADSESVASPQLLSLEYDENGPVLGLF